MTAPDYAAEAALLAQVEATTRRCPCTHLAHNGPCRAVRVSAGGRVKTQCECGGGQ